MNYFDNNASWIIVSVLLLCAAVYKIACHKSALHPFDKSNTLGIRGLMALLIIFCHTAHEYLANAFIRFGADFGAPVVGIFLFLSGYGLVKSYVKDPAKFMHQFIPRNLIKILPVLIITTALSIILMWLILHRSPIIALKGYLQGKPPLAYSWFMYLLLALYFVFYICFLRLRRHIVSVALIFAFTIAIYVGLRALDWGVYWYLSIFAFNAGNTIALFEKRILQIVSRYPSICALVILALLVGCGVMGIRNGIIVLCIAVYLSIIYCGGLNGLIWKSLGTHAYEIYLAHGVCVPLIVSMGLDWSLTLCLNLIFSVALAYPLKIVADKFSLIRHLE